MFEFNPVPFLLGFMIGLTIIGSIQILWVRHSCRKLEREQREREEKRIERNREEFNRLRGSKGNTGYQDGTCQRSSSS
jgi:cell division protein FtsL